MGGPSDRTEQRRSYSEYHRAVLRINAAMQRLRELNVIIEPGPMNRPPEAWTSEQREAMHDTVIAWYELVMKRRAYEAVWHASHPRDWQ